MSVTTSRIVRQDLLAVAEIVAREKNIDRDQVIEAIELALQKAARAKFGHEIDLRVSIDSKSGEIVTQRVLTVVEIVENPVTEINLADAKKIDPLAVLGGEIRDILPPIDFGRVAAQTAKQVVIQKVRDVERENQYEEFKNRLFDIINGVVRRVEYGNVYVDLGRGEALLRRDDMIPRESFRVGDRVRALISDVRREAKGAQVLLSRTHPQFMAKLFSQEVPEVYDGVIQIKAVARDPGSRAKIAVYSRDSSLDPVGACVGMRGVRVQAVVTELQGEKVDIVPWSSDMATFIVNALAPAEVLKVVLDEDTKSLDVVIQDDQLSLAIGRRGQNVRLASQLVGMNIDILTEKEESERRNEELKVKSQLFMMSLNVDEVIAHLLAGEGFSTIEEVAFVESSDLMDIEGFDDELAVELQSRAKRFLQDREDQMLKACRDLGVEEELIHLDGLTLSMVVKLGQNSIRTVDDLAELSLDEVQELLKEFNVADEILSQIIMTAREKWFEDPTAS